MEVSKQRKELKKDLALALSKAWEDQAFKSDLLSNPRVAIENLTGRKLSLKEDMKFVVSDQSSQNTLYFNLPSKPDLDNIELNQEQLETVAGGGFIDWAEEQIETYFGWKDALSL